MRRLRSRWRRPRLRDVRIVYRLLIVNALIVAVPIVGMAFARMHERQLLARLEADMIDQAELLRAVLVHDPAGLGLATRGPMLADAARRTSTRIRLLDAAGAVRADSRRGAPAEPLGARVEVVRALAGAYGSATRLWDRQDEVYLYAALPIATAAATAARASPAWSTSRARPRRSRRRWSRCGGGWCASACCRSPRPRW